MRISDWSSDVCSSDLPFQLADIARQCVGGCGSVERTLHANAGKSRCGDHPRASGHHRSQRGEAGQRPDRDRKRSEEHTSELQSLMRISYAVFCLKNKNKINTINTPAIQTTRDT